MALDADLVAYPQEEDLPAAIRDLDIPEAALAAAAVLPVTLHGELDTGETVTILHARNHGEQRWPKYVGDNCIRGALVSGPQHLYSAVRFRIGAPYWLDHLSAAQPSTVPDDGSTLLIEPAADGNLLVDEAAEPIAVGKATMLSRCSED